MMQNGASAKQNGATGSNSNEHLHSIVSTVPSDLKTLIRIVMRTFYGFELFLCMEMLLIYPCMKEDDLAELLRLDCKVVHQYLINLKKEKFLNEKSIMETSADGKQSKHSYFYINYKMLVNVIKYKLDKIRIQIELDENQFTTRANFKCTHCHKTYSDLDTKDIFLTMRCLYCGSDVDEDVSSMPKQSARNLLNKFNTQMSVLFELLSKVEHICLADFILRPEPVDMSYVLERMNPNQVNPNASKTNGANNGLSGRSAMIKYDKWSGDKTRNTDIFGQTKITINFDSNNSANPSQKKAKELPSILLLNRVPEEDPTNRDSELLNSVKLAADETINNSNSSSQHNKSTLSDATNTSLKISTTNLLQMNGINLAIKPNLNSNQSSASNANSSSNQVGNLEDIIMDKLLKHEKKASSSEPEPAPSVSSISITKKRPNEHLNTAALEFNNNNNNNCNLNKNQSSDFSLINHKKRKLNNGDIVGIEHSNLNGYKNGYTLKRNHSDGSENSDEYDEDYDDDYDYDYEYQNDLHCSSSSSSSSSLGGSGESSEDCLIPRVFVRNKPIRFDRINPKLISLMTESEKENYINICRQLYTEMYET